MIQVGAVGVDAFGNNNWTCDGLIAVGATIPSVYICQETPATKPKIILASKCTEFRNGGLTPIFNYEWYQGRPLDGNGTADGLVAAIMAIARGGLPGEYITCSVDTNAGGFLAGGRPQRPEELPIVGKYLKNFRAAIAQSGFRFGVYAGGWLIRWLFDNGFLFAGDLIWQPKYAWSDTDDPRFPYIAPETHIVQAGQTFVNGVKSDLNRVIKAFDPTGAAPLPQPPEVAMPDYIAVDPGGNLYAVGDAVKPITGWELASVPSYRACLDAQAGAALTPDQPTLDRMAVYLDTGRWPKSDGSLPAPQPIVAKVDTAAIAAAVTASVVPAVTASVVPAVTAKIPTTFKAL